ncbi:hypothetical protein [Nonomuraea sp. B19D2]|uniref:hypothetical protein n=1 Tax=Nonomuraea sp. B19D2 TaxID=3159561 RepID=UPI0032DA5C52
MMTADGRLTGLGNAFAHYGRICKSLHLLQVLHVEDYRRMTGHSCTSASPGTRWPGGCSEIRARLSPLLYEHINFHGFYPFNRPDLGGRLRDPTAT